MGKSITFRTCICNDSTEYTLYIAFIGEKLTLEEVKSKPITGNLFTKWRVITHLVKLYPDIHKIVEEEREKHRKLHATD